MKRTVGLVAILLLCSGIVYAEKVHSGDYTTASRIGSDFIVHGGSINIATGDLIVDGDLKVTSGEVQVLGGNLIVDGDLIVTNTSLTAMQNARVIVQGGDLVVTGAIITKSDNLDANVRAMDSQGVGGTIYAGKICTRARDDADVQADHDIHVTGEIITKSLYSNATVVSYGLDYSGSIYAGSIATYARYGAAYVTATYGNIAVNGLINTRAYYYAYVSAEGVVTAGEIFTEGLYYPDYVSGEQVNVIGDIRVGSGLSTQETYVEARQSIYPNQGDIHARSIYTDGYYGGHVRAYTDVVARGDIVTRNRAVGDPGPQSAYVWAETGYIKAQNVATRGVSASYVKAQEGIDVSGDIITKSYGDDAYVYTYSSTVKAQNVSTNARQDAYVECALHDVDVKRAIRTDQLLEEEAIGSAYVRSVDRSVKSEKIFTAAQGDASVTAGAEILVKGPIKTYSTESQGRIIAFSNIVAGGIDTYADNNAYVRSTNGSINVVEDIKTLSMHDDAYVRALSGDIRARSIKTGAMGQNDDDSIQAAAGSGHFQWAPNGPDQDIAIKDSRFDFDHDRDWNTLLSLYGTCTIDGCDHQLNFGESGAIIVKSGAKLLLKNIDLQNIGPGAIVCEDNTAELSLYNVTLTVTKDYTFGQGVLHILGDVDFAGYGKSFAYQSDGQCTIHANSKWKFDNGMSVDYASATEDRIVMENSSSVLHFDSANFRAVNDIRLSVGTLRIDNYVRFLALGASDHIYFGTGSPAGNLTLDFGQGSRLVYGDRVINNNA